MRPWHRESAKVLICVKESAGQADRNRVVPRHLFRTTPAARRVAGRLLLPAALAFLMCPRPTATAQGLPDYELPPINYSASTPSNRFSTLDLASPEAPAGSGREFVRWLLEQFDVPEASQVLVFSKTSLQRDLISPSNPRALYFSEDAYIGWVPGGLVEIAVTDPNLGIVFYKLDPRDRPDRRLHRDADCLSCHGGSMTRDWPGLMVRSVFTDPRGQPITAAGSTLVGHDTPFEERWGGWYVTGRHGNARHRGNVTAPDRGPNPRLDIEAGANVETLERFFDVSLYPSPGSDIVALMVLEHQVLIHNRLAEGALRVRKWSDYQRRLQEELGEPVTDMPTGTALRVVNTETERIVEALLFCDEIVLPEGGIHGTPDFIAAFSCNRRADPSGRSLKDFDLQTRLFRYRCSYMIHSDAFASLPRQLKRSVFRRLDDILTASRPPRRFAHLTAGERADIREILLATHPEFAAFVGGSEG